MCYHIIFDFDPKKIGGVMEMTIIIMCDNKVGDDCNSSGDDNDNNDTSSKDDNKNSNNMVVVV